MISTGRSAHELLVIASLIDRPFYYQPEADPIDAAASLVDAVKRNHPGLLESCYGWLESSEIGTIVIDCHYKAHHP